MPLYAYTRIKAYNGNYTVLVTNDGLTRRKKTYFDVSCTLPLGQNKMKPTAVTVAGMLEYRNMCASPRLCVYNWDNDI